MHPALTIETHPTLSLVYWGELERCARHSNPRVTGIEENH